MDWLTVARKLLPYAIVFMIGAALAGGAAWMIQGTRVNSAEAELSQTLADLRVSKNNEEACQDANKINQATIGSLQEEVKASLQGCDSRLTAKDKTLRNLKRISELKAGAVNGGINEVGKNSSGDPVFDELNSMYVPANGGTGSSKDGVHPTAGAEPAT